MAEEQKTPEERDAQIDRIEEAALAFAERFLRGEASVEVRPIGGHLAGGFTIRLKLW